MVEKCNACRGLSCKMENNALVLTDNATRGIGLEPHREVRENESIEQCAVRNKFIIKTIYERSQ